MRKLLGKDDIILFILFPWIYDCNECKYENRFWWLWKDKKACTWLDCLIKIYISVENTNMEMDPDDCEEIKRIECLT